MLKDDIQPFRYITNAGRLYEIEEVQPVGNSVKIRDCMVPADECHGDHHTRTVGVAELIGNYDLVRITDPQ